eukprot:1176439-Prorocentrum_minimum.AAC.2
MPPLGPSMRPPPTDPLGDASRRRSARPIAWRGRASSRKQLPVTNIPVITSDESHIESRTVQ